MVTVFAGIVFFGTAVLAASRHIQCKEMEELYKKKLNEYHKHCRERDIELERLQRAKEEYEAIKGYKPLD